MSAVADTKVGFSAHFVSGVRARSKSDCRKFVAQLLLRWCRLQHRRKRTGAVILDIDDTLINGTDKVINGFEHMWEAYQAVSLLFPIHIVTARPHDQHPVVMRLLKERGICIATDRLHMLPTELWENGDASHVENFKWARTRAVHKLHRGVVARAGDKMWDVAPLEAIRGRAYLKHVDDAHAYVFLDPRHGGCASFKLPGTS